MRVRRRRAAWLLPVLLLAGGCASKERTKALWGSFKTVGVRTSFIEGLDAELERSWLSRMLVIELKRSKLFREAAALGPDSPTADLHVSARIVDVRRGRSLKIFLEIDFVDVRGAKSIARWKTAEKSSIRMKLKRDHHKAAGQVAVAVARRIVDYIREKRLGVRHM